MRGGGAFRAKIAVAQEKGVLVLAWLSFIVAIIGGAYAADTFIGDFVNSIFDFMPWSWLAPAVLGLAFIVLVIDLFLDLTPNRGALYSVMLLPSVARSVSGDLGDRVQRWSGQLQDVGGNFLTRELGGLPYVALAVVCLVGAHLMGKRVISKAAGMPAGAR